MNNIQILPSLMVFTEVARHRSFTGAAKHLGLSKSAVSQHVARLEQEIGGQLMSRNTRVLSLTTLGNQLLARTEHLSGQVDLALMEIAAAEQSPSGPFAVTLPHSIEKCVLIPAISQLSREFPKLEPRIVVTDTALDLIAEGIDVSLFIGWPKDSSYRSLPVGTAHEIFCAAPGYVQAHGLPQTPAELEAHDWLNVCWQSDEIMLKPNAGGPAVPLTLRPRMRCSTLSSAVDLALLDMGIVLVPDVRAAALIAEGQLVPLVPGYHASSWPVHFLHPYQGSKPRHVARFYELVRLYFGRAKIVEAVPA